MFTGIIEAKATLIRVERSAAGVDICLRVGALASGAVLGQSFSLNGCCLTVTRLGDGELWFQAVPETLSRTALGSLKEGSELNVERAMAADGRFDGHIVQGHVDEVGSVRELAQSAADVRLHVGCSEEFSALLVPKGSVAINGVSLTVADLGPVELSVALIPHTLQETTLGQLHPDSPVNLEADVRGKYGQKYLRSIAGGGGQAPD